MARQAAVNIDNNFIQGLITEAGALSFPEKACTETYDCVFTRNGKVSRRPAFNAEVGEVPFSVDSGEGVVATEYLWTAVGGIGTVSILVVQQGDKIYFFDVEDVSNISASKRSESIDLDIYVPSGSAKLPANYPCSFSQGNGDLLVANPAISPFYVRYDNGANSLTATSITVQFRDFTGLDDGLSSTSRPTDTVSGIKTNNPAHYYNLLNQGWYANSADALSQWDTALSSLPSNADVPGLFRSSETDTFDAARVSAKDAGNVPAPKGHFILTAWDPDRTAAMVAEGFTGATLTSTTASISGSTGTALTFGSYSGDPSYAHNGVTNATNSTLGNVMAFLSGGVTHTNFAFGKNYTSSPKRISKAVIHGPNDTGYSVSNFSITATLYGKQGSSPANATDGTSLGSITFTDTSNESAGRTITSSNTTTYYDYVWVNWTHAAHLDGISVVELIFHTPVTSDIDDTSTTERPSCTAFFAGRSWFAGIDAQGRSNNIYFSQIIEKRNQYGYCYQKNDPAGEYYNDLLADDGGVIKILEMGSVVKLFATRSAIFCFATNGIWSISGTSGSGFKATDYVVRRISSVGTVSRLSFIDFKGQPVWWAEDGIYGISFDAQTDSFSAENITLKTIKTFFTDILPSCRAIAKGAYDSVNDYIYWLYSTTPGNYVYDRVLVMNGATGAFFPWTISGGANYDGLQAVTGVAFVVDPALTTSPRVKYVTITPDLNALTYEMSFAEARNYNPDPYVDWATNADWGGDLSYSSYFITGYKIHGDTQRYFQPNYLYVFMDTETNASMRVQAVYDFTNSGNSGKWSSVQEAYNNNLYQNRDISIRRLKVRGKGRAIQFKYQSTEGKPFTALGWSVMESVNSGL